MAGTNTVLWEFETEFVAPSRYILNWYDRQVAEWASIKLNGMTDMNNVPVISKCWEIADAALTQAYEDGLPEDVQRECWTVGMLRFVAEAGTSLEEIYFNTVIDHICDTLADLAVRTGESVTERMQRIRKCGITTRIVEYVSDRLCI